MTARSPLGGLRCCVRRSGGVATDAGATFRSMFATAALRLGPVPMWHADTMPDDLDLKVRTETLVGPVHGYFLACYSVESGDGFYGYAKVHVHRPTCVWGARPAVAKY